MWREVLTKEVCSEVTLRSLTVWRGDDYPVTTALTHLSSLCSLSLFPPVTSTSLVLLYFCSFSPTHSRVFYRPRSGRQINFWFTIFNCVARTSTLLSPLRFLHFLGLLVFYIYLSLSLPYPLSLFDQDCLLFCHLKVHSFCVTPVLSHTLTGMTALKPFQ